MSSASSSGDLADAGGDGAPATGGSQECKDYCASLQATSCRFELDQPNNYPDANGCLSICELIRTEGDRKDTIACRTEHIAAGATQSCAAAGPWGVDFDKGIFCTNDVCLSICHAKVAKCGGVQADCFSACSLADDQGGTPPRECMMKTTLQMYRPGETKSGVEALCGAYADCKNAK